LVDTGILVADALAKDHRHDEAVEILDRIAVEDPFTTDHVVIEAWALVNLRAGYFHAMRFWRALRETPLAVEPLIVADLERAQAIADLWADQQFDIVECTSFAAMERTKCSRAASFDSDFLIYRYGADRKKAFEVLGLSGDC